MNKRITSTAVLAAMLLSLVACGDTAKISDDTTAPKGDTESTSIAPDSLGLETKDWGGKEFRVLGRETQYTQFNNFEIYAEAENGEVVNDAIYRRNALVEEKYGVKISQTLVENPTSSMQSAILAGDDLYDLAFLQLNQIATSAQDGYLYNLYNVDHIDFDKPWWNPEVNKSVELGGKLFFTSSDFSLRDKNRAYIMVHNRDMANEYGIPSIVDMVRAGTWTIDKMTEYSKLVANDVGNDGMIPIDDRWGTVMDSIHSFALFCYSTGNRILKRGNSGNLELVMNNEHMISSIDKILSLTCDTSSAFFSNHWAGKVSYDFNSASSKTFYANNALFITSFPHSLKNYSANSEFDYGVIPPPKYDEKQENYYTLADTYGMLFGIPTSTATPDFSGFMLEALSYYSTDTVLPAYYEISCKTKYTYDKDSAEMLDLIFENIIYDLGYILEIGGIHTIIKGDMASGTENLFASLYAAKESAAKAELDEIIKRVGELE